MNINKERKHAAANQYHAAHNRCKDGDIIAILDGDDSFIGRQILSLYNAVYHKTKSAIVYSKFIRLFDNEYAYPGLGSIRIKPDVLKKRKFRQTKRFHTSHLLTFYTDIYRKIELKDLTYPNGTFFVMGGDVAMSTPIV